MASVYEMARALGEELQKTPQVQALLEAKKAYESDPVIGKEIEEYTRLIKSNKLASDLFAAEMNFNNFMNSVFNIITSTLSGEEPDMGGGCDPSCCSSCGGGCH